MADRKECAHEMLAAGPIAKVRRCRECDVVSIELGPTTVRLEPGAVESLWSTLGRAIEAMRARREPPPLTTWGASPPRGLS
ncbi:MAG: hypothetical protein HYV09_08810 [Deltaproteobacteria bacterium]|nr:hypothetical protein [Deltaproteobacteria bacterium]